MEKNMSLMGVLLFFCVLIADAQSNKIIRLQELRFDAMVNRDTAYLRKYTDEGLVYIHSNGLVQSQDDFVQSVGMQSIVYQKITIKEQQARVYKKAAIINGIVQVKGLFNGTAFDVALRFTDVYVYKKGWKMASWQSLKL
jgi:Domain of unknown function (DUF4440)